MLTTINNYFLTSDTL